VSRGQPGNSVQEIVVRCGTGGPSNSQERKSSSGKKEIAQG
jgi:hypothetical protein